MLIRYVAYDAYSKRRKGTMEGPDPSWVENALIEQGMTPVKVEPVRASILQADIDISRWTGRISSTEVSFLCRQLASVLRVGLPLTSAIAMQRETSPNPRLRAVLADLENRLRSGQALWEALSGHPDVILPMYVDMLRAAERAGYTADALDRISQHIEKAGALRKKVIGALIYPSIVALMALTGISVLIFFVMPKMKELLDSLDVALPAPTRLMLAVTDFAVGNRLLIGAVCVAAAAVPALAARFPEGRFWMDRMKLEIPLVGRVLRMAGVASYARVLAEVMAVGLPMGEALPALQSSLGNLYLQKKFAAVIPLVMAGEGLSRPVARTGILPPEAVQMTRLGEESGNLPEVARELAHFYEQEADRAIKILTDSLEPLLIAVLGGAVLFVALSIITPMYQAYGNMK